MSDICLITTIAGTINVMYEGQLEYLRDYGHELTLITGGDEVEINRLRARQVGEVIAVPLVRPPRPLTDLKALYRLIVHFATHRHDIVVVTTPKAILLGALAAFVTGQPRRVVFFQGRVYENFKGGRRWFYKMLDRVAVWCAHEVAFVSPSLMSVYAQEGKSFIDKGVVIGHGSINGVNGQKFNVERIRRDKIRAIKSELNVDEDSFVVVIIGRICRDKGIEELDALILRALRSGKPFVFVFVGWIEDDAAAQFAQIRRRANVRYAGPTENVELYLATADLHLFLTHREGFGNVAIEAAAMTVPTIAFDVVGVKDSVCQGVSGVRVALGDIDEVWRLMGDMLSADDSTRHNRYQRARKWALDGFGQEVVWKNYEKFYSRRK